MTQEMLVFAHQHQQLRPRLNMVHTNEHFDDETFAELKALGYMK